MGDPGDPAPPVETGTVFVFDTPASGEGWLVIGTASPSENEDVADQVVVPVIF